MNPSVASEKIYFTEMANGNRRIPLSPRRSWWVKLYRLRRHNIQTSFWLIPPQKNKFTLSLPRQRTNWSKKPPGRSRPGTFLDRYYFLCGSMQQHYRDICPASGHTCRCCHKTDHFAGFCQQVAKENGASRPASHTPTPPGPRREYMRLVEQEEHSYTLPVEGIQY